MFYYGVEKMNIARINFFRNMQTLIENILKEKM